MIIGFDGKRAVQNNTGLGNYSVTRGKDGNHLSRQPIQGLRAAAP